LIIIVKIKSSEKIIKIVIPKFEKSEIIIPIGKSKITNKIQVILG